MKITKVVKNILNNYESDNPGTKANIARILMHGKLAGTGKLFRNVRGWCRYICWTDSNYIKIK